MPPKVRGSEVGFAVLAALALRHLSGCQTCLAFLHISRGLRALLNAPIGLRVVGFFYDGLTLSAFLLLRVNAMQRLAFRDVNGTILHVVCCADFVIAVRIS